MTAKKNEECCQLQGLYYDSKKDKTLIRTSQSEGYTQEVQDHYVMLNHENQFLGHFSAPKIDPLSPDATVSIAFVIDKL